MNEELFKLLGLNPETARGKAIGQGLLGSIFQAAALSGPQPRPVSTAQALGQVGLTGMGAYESSFDKTLKEAITGLQVKDLVRKQTESEQLRSLLPQVFRTTRGPSTTETIASEQGDDVLTRPGPVTGVSIDPAKLQALMMIPGGAEAVRGLAETQKLVRQAGLGGAGGEAPSPFSVFANAENPRVKSLAAEYDKAFKAGLITEEDAYKRLEPLARLEESFVGRQPKPREAMGDELKLRESFRNEPVYKAYQETQTAFSQITEGIKKQSPAGDLAAATKFMKLLDPGSVVRESELFLAMKASGLLDRAVNYANMTISGQKLTPTQRADFQQLANNLYKASVDAYNVKHSEYANIAKQYGLNPNMAVGPIATFSLGETPETPSPKQSGTPSLRSILFPNKR